MNKNHTFSQLIIAFCCCFFFLGKGPTHMNAQATHTGDSLELVNFFNSTGGPNWDTPWDLTMPVSSWNGIYLTTIPPRRVQEIWLSHDGLAGTLPDLNLPELENLYVYGNDLIGAMPALDSCRKLEILEAYNNDFGGLLPDFNLPELQRIDLSSNNFAGTLPGLDSLVKLKRLELYDNDFSGAVPDFQLPLVESVSLNLNKLNSIPNFSGMPALETLSLSDNSQLGGQIPDFNLPALTGLYMENCDLEGHLPALTNCPNLLHLFLHGNINLDGAIPNYSITHPNMLNLELSGCRFTSCPPLTGFTNLSRLYLSSNRLTYQDLLPQVGLASLLYTYAYQDYVEPIEPYYNLPDGASVELHYPTDSMITTNIYEWRKDGVPFDTTSTNSLWMHNLTTADNGEYICRVTNPALPGMYIQIYPIHLTVVPPPPPADPADSMILVGLYNATGGTSWTVSWDLTQPVHSWAGVSLNTNGQVTSLSLGNRGMTDTLPSLDLPALTSLNLQNNSLTGAIPSFTNCPDLQSVYLSNNQFTSCADQSAAANLITFFVLGNHLTFEDLVPNAGISNFSYSPQASTPSQDRMAATGGNLDLHFPIDSMITDNHYVWYRNGQAIDSLNANSLMLNNLSLADSGTYHCLATNTALPELTLALDSFHVSVSVADQLDKILASDIQLAPNPAIDVLSISLNESLFVPTEGWSVRIVDLQGRIVMTSGPLAARNIQLDVGHLPAGIYVAELIGGGKHWMQKWLKSN